MRCAARSICTTQRPRSSLGAETSMAASMRLRSPPGLMWSIVTGPNREISPPGEEDSVRIAAGALPCALGPCLRRIFASRCSATALFEPDSRALMNWATSFSASPSSAAVAVGAAVRWERALPSLLGSRGGFTLVANRGVDCGEQLSARQRHAEAEQRSRFTAIPFEAFFLALPSVAGGQAIVPRCGQARPHSLRRKRKYFAQCPLAVVAV